ncbi:hypothetical protein MHU86_7789 [Fragilaria crotonensis]|nr:hypothetical protein MHU86_7789 [Fragilaria crotonensis]
MRCVVLLVCLAFAHGSASSSNGSSDTKPVLSGSKPDPWVEAAPLILVVCRNGVALVAIHPTPASQNDKNTTNEEIGDNGNNHDDDDDYDDDYWTKTYRDTARIHQIDSQGTALLCSGWRTDGEWLAETCRSISRDEVRSLVLPPHPFLPRKRPCGWPIVPHPIRCVLSVWLDCWHQRRTQRHMTQASACYIWSMRRALIVSVLMLSDLGQDCECKIESNTI